jgi:hypothetical protein
MLRISTGRKKALMLHTVGKLIAVGKQKGQKKRVQLHPLISHHFMTKVIIF